MKWLLRHYRIYNLSHFRKCLFFSVAIALVIVPLSLSLALTGAELLALTGADLTTVLCISAIPIALLLAVYPFTYLSIMQRIDRGAAGPFDTMAIGVVAAAIIAALTAVLVSGGLAIHDTMTSSSAHKLGIIELLVTILLKSILGGLLASLYSIIAAPAYIPVGAILGYLNYHFLKNTPKEIIEQALKLTKETAP